MSKRSKTLNKGHKKRENTYNKQNRLEVDVARQVLRPWLSEELLKPSIKKPVPTPAVIQRGGGGGSLSLNSILEKVKTLYQQKQSIETVEIIEKEIGPRKTYKFTVTQPDGKSLSLFNLVIKPSYVPVVELVTADNDYRYENPLRLENHLKKLVENRVELLTKYYGKPNRS